MVCDKMIIGDEYMLGAIIGIEEDTVLVKLNIDLNKFQNLVNLHVVMEDANDMLVGEIVDIKDGMAYVNLMGQIINNEFVFGVMRKPSFGASVKLISKEKIPMIISVDNPTERKDVFIGESPIYPGVRIGFNINDFLLIILRYLGQLVVVSLGELRDLFKVFLIRGQQLLIGLVFLFLMLMASIMQLLRL